MFLYVTLFVVCNKMIINFIGLANWQCNAEACSKTSNETQRPTDYIALHETNTYTVFCNFMCNQHDKTQVHHEWKI